MHQESKPSFSSPGSLQPSICDLISSAELPLMFTMPSQCTPYGSNSMICAGDNPAKQKNDYVMEPTSQ